MLLFLLPLLFLEFLARGEVAPVCFLHTVFLGLLILFAFLFDDCTVVFTRKGDIPDVLYASIIFFP
jgi:hypothetical protein